MLIGDSVFAELAILKIILKLEEEECDSVCLQCFTTEPL